MTPYDMVFVRIPTLPSRETTPFTLDKETHLSFAMLLTRPAHGWWEWPLALYDEPTNTRMANAMTYDNDPQTI